MVTDPAGVGLLDTSVFVAMESGRSINVDALPAESVVSVVTVAELRAGVLGATDLRTRESRLRTLEKVTGIAHLAVDDAVAEVWAELRIRLRDASRRVNVNDLWIAATAAAHGLTVYGQDDDYLPLQDLGGPPFVRV